MEDIIENICENLNIGLFDYFVKPRGGKPGIQNFELIEAILINGTIENSMKFINYGYQIFYRNKHKIFPPDIILHGGGESWRYYLLANSKYKRCGSCNSIKLRYEFSIDSSKSDNLDTKCKECKSSHNKLRLNRIKQATPGWADLEEINLFYKNTPINMTVDHIYPLVNEISCGLHVIENLQYLSLEDNCSKGTKLPK